MSSLRRWDKSMQPSNGKSNWQSCSVSNGIPKVVLISQTLQNQAQNQEKDYQMVVCYHPHFLKPQNYLDVCKHQTSKRKHRSVICPSNEEWTYQRQREANRVETVLRVFTWWRHQRIEPQRDKEGTKITSWQSPHCGQSQLHLCPFWTTHVLRFPNRRWEVVADFLRMRTKLYFSLKRWIFQTQKFSKQRTWDSYRLGHCPLWLLHENKHSTVWEVSTVLIHTKTQAKQFRQNERANDHPEWWGPDSKSLPLTSEVQKDSSNAREVLIWDCWQSLHWQVAFHSLALVVILGVFSSENVKMWLLSFQQMCISAWLFF